jgi:RNA polymerase sigma-70 factor (ECF subfamily)
MELPGFGFRLYCRRMGTKTNGQDEFIKFWRQTCSKVRAYMFCVCHNGSDADDLTQDCCMRAIRSWGTFAGAGTRQAWLFAIARSTRVDWIRKRRRQNRGLEACNKDGRREAPTEQSCDEAEAIWQAVRRLGLDQQEVVHLRFAAGLSYAEIADTLGVPVGTIRSRLHRGLQALRELIEE